MTRLCNLLRSFGVMFFITVFLSSGAVYADDIKSIRSMLKKSVETGDQAAFDTVLHMALATWPDKRSAILMEAEALQADWMAITQLEELEAAREAAVATEQASRARGIIYYLDPVLWNGQINLGASASTGDTEETSFAVGLSFNRQFGPEWEHGLDLDFDRTTSSGVTKRQRFVTKYETTWRPWDKTFLLNYVELELDHFSGYDYRIVENIGVGFQLVDSVRHKLRLEGGPGLRFSKEEETGFTNTEFLGRLSSTYDWKVSSTMSLRDRTSVIFATTSTTVENDLRLTAKLNSHLSARISFKARYDSAPPLGTSAWDTVTRASLVFGF